MIRKLSRRSFISSVTGTGLAIVSFPVKPSPKKKTREQVINQLNKLVDEYMPVYRTCSQTTFHALNEVFKLKADEFIRALAPFPGIAMRGETCGTVSGALCAIALAYETKVPGEKLSDKPSQDFCKSFEKEFGSTRCRDVIKFMTKKEYVILTPSDYNVLISEGALSHCNEVAKKAVSIAADIIMNNEGVTT